jgi:hypothetical protein
MRKITVFSLLLLVGCSHQKQSGWEDIDYSKVRNREIIENDSNYRSPSVAACVDDDLYNCK